jgi:hypothetical protein
VGQLSLEGEHLEAVCQQPIGVRISLEHIEKNVGGVSTERQFAINPALPRKCHNRLSLVGSRAEW